MKTILLVEDTPHLSEEIADILRLEGYSVSIAKNGLEAVDLLSSLTPDLIVTDLLMPGLDGFGLIERVRLLPRVSTVPVIILSAKTSEEDRARGKQIGANAFVGKPCKAHELVKTISDLLPENK